MVLPPVTATRDLNGKGGRLLIIWPNDVDTPGYFALKTVSKHQPANINEHR